MNYSSEILDCSSEQQVASAAMAKQPVKASLLQRAYRALIRVVTLDSFWETLTYSMAESFEPQVKQGRDRYGKLCWLVCNPATQVWTTFGSELEALAWLEQRYYRQTDPMETEILRYLPSYLGRNR